MARRRTKAQVETLDRLRSALVPGEVAKLTLTERAHLQVEQLRAREQDNREAIAHEAVTALRELDVCESPGSPIDHTWLNIFWDYASQISDPDLQEAWGRVLARQSAGDDSSLRMLQVLQALSASEAAIISSLAPFVVSVSPREDITYDGVMHEIKMHTFEDDSQVGYSSAVSAYVPLPPYGVAADILGPIGIYTESGWAWDVITQVKNGEAFLLIGDRELKMRGECLRNAKMLRIGSGIRLSGAGKEIFRLPATSADNAFLSAVTDAARSLGCIVEVNH